MPTHPPDGVLNAFLHLTSLCFLSHSNPELKGNNLAIFSPMLTKFGRVSIATIGAAQSERSAETLQPVEKNDAADGDVGDDG